MFISRKKLEQRIEVLEASVRYLEDREKEHFKYITEIAKKVNVKDK